jgi:hypothetical protein
MKCHQYCWFAVGMAAMEATARRAIWRSEVKIAGTEESNQPDDDQIKGDDIV